MSVVPEDPDIIPNLNRDGVFEYLTGLGYVVTRNAVKEAAASGRLETRRVGHRNLHSRADARKWIHEGCLLDRTPESAAAQ
jgi:hypothetical protein